MGREMINIYDMILFVLVIFIICIIIGIWLSNKKVVSHPTKLCATCNKWQCDIGSCFYYGKLTFLDKIILRSNCEYYCFWENKNVKTK